MAKTEVDLQVYFQELRREDGVIFDLATVLDHIMALPLVDRNVPIGSDIVRLETFFSGKHCKMYDLVKLRMNDHAETGGLAAPTAALPLKDDEGIAERTVFAVPRGTNVVAVCRTIYGLRAEGIATYVSHFLQGDVQLNASIIQTYDPMERAQALETVRKVVFEVSRPALQASNARGVVRVREKLASWLAFGGNTISVELNVGAAYRRGGLVNNEVQDLVEALHRSDAVEKLQLFGVKQNGGRDMIDFMTNRLVETVRVTTTGARRGVTARDRSVAVEEAVTRNREYLEGFTNNRAQV